ncbi:hypothetical protein KI387_014914 [Taxus chinensis]|uniref:non-specific serine/threonine protein kinase n=1 Tax=Taxus chinensis TaxID=29808 RepID=A0AA38CNZ8_TAXCH|nr:hypothetical protein KI387_014914 [Taxus chinensis]
MGRRDGEAVWSFGVVVLFLLRFCEGGRSEAESLVEFRRYIGDPGRFLTSWRPSEGSPCEWKGVKCTVGGAVKSVDLRGMNLTGSFSADVCDLQNLTELSLGDNKFNQTIPLELTRCRSLTVLNLSDNYIWGTVPEQISELKTLQFLDFSGLSLEGRIPDALGELEKLNVLNLGFNWFTGTVPPEIGNLTELRVLDLSNNERLAPGSIPAEIGNLVNLEELHLYMSMFTGRIPGELGNLKALKLLDLSQNNLSGPIPIELTGLRNLVYLHLDHNVLSGEIPDSISNLRSLKQLDLGKNGLSGRIPDGVSELYNLEVLTLYMNQLTGPLPPGIVNLKKLSEVLLHTNFLTGTLPQELGLNASFTTFEISLNNIRGSIPPNLCHGGRLQNLSLHTNRFSGSIPKSFSQCHSLVRLTLQNNKLNGDFPNGLWSAPNMTIIRLENNRISGVISPEISQASQLAQIQIDNNQFTGAFPPELSELGSLYKLSASQNLFTGNFPPNNILGYYSGRPTWNTTSFYHLGFNEDEIVSKLDEKNLVGSGGSGKVYKVILPSGEPVAVKRLWKTGKVWGGRQTGTLKTEIETLGKVRHRNIVKMLCCSSSEETSVLVYEYVPNGSLADVFHSSSDIVLDWSVRFNIAMGAAQGLAYLHHDFVPQVLHRDIKSSNILLDSNYEPKLTDFGLAKILGDSAHLQSISYVVGSYGYIAPEYAYSTKVNEKIDVYSFGVVLLELITGKRAVEVDHGDLIDVVKWVRGKVNTKDGIWKVLDPRIREKSEQEMEGALRIALLCTSVLPQCRPSMNEWWLKCFSL